MLGRANTVLSSGVVRMTIIMVRNFHVRSRAIRSMVNRIDLSMVFPRVLVIEDDSALRDMLSFVLRQRCFDSQLLITLS